MGEVWQISRYHWHLERRSVMWLSSCARYEELLQNISNIVEWSVCVHPCVCVCDGVCVWWWQEGGCLTNKWDDALAKNKYMKPLGKTLYNIYSLKTIESYEHFKDMAWMVGIDPSMLVHFWTELNKREWSIHSFFCSNYLS